MSTSLTFANDSTDAEYGVIYRALQKLSGAENDSLYQAAIASCTTQKQIRAKAGRYAGVWQEIFNAWCENKLPNVAVIPLLFRPVLTRPAFNQLVERWR